MPTIGTDVWAGTRSTKPPIVELMSTENRKISVSLSPAVVAGETIQGSTLVGTVVNYRTGLPVTPTPLVLPLSYDSVSKVAAARLNGSLLPHYDPSALILTFDVTGPAGTEQRSVYVVVNVAI